MQMAGRTNAACGVAGNIGLCPHKKYPRLRRGIFIMRMPYIISKNGRPVIPLRSRNNDKNHLTEMVEKWYYYINDKTFVR